MKNILVDLPVHRASLMRLEALSNVCVTCIEPADDARELPAELLRDRHILLCNTPPSNFGDMSALEVIQIASVGCEQLYGLDLAARGIRACNARGVLDMSIAEWNVGMMINLARDVRGMIRNQERGVWDRAERFQRELRGAVIGLWGYGGIGRETARLAKALGLVVHVLSRRPVGPRRNVYAIPGTGDPDGTLPDRVFLPGQERAFLGGLDFLVLALPLTAKSRGLVGRGELESLRRTAFLLNPARGPIVDEGALLAALREGTIAGAALDTHYYYPMPVDHPLWRFPNVIMTPHVSGAPLSQYFPERIWDLCVQNVERYSTGQPLLNELTPAELTGGG
jgi:phosphoglycerate dehydrogenase-like enzyme